MGNELITVQKDEIETLERIAKYAVDSKYFDKLGGFAGIFSVVMYARELGIPPMHALFGGMRPVMGKVEVSPQQMNAMIRKAGHRIKIVEQNDNRCILTGTRADTGDTCTVSFSLEDARRAGLVKNGGGYEKWTSDMLWARAMSRLGRRLFPDVIGMSYVTGEIKNPDEADSFQDVDVVEEKEVEIKPETILSREDLIQKVKEKTNLSCDLFNEYLNYLEGRCVGKTPSFYDVLKLSVDDPTRIIEGYNTWIKKEKKTAVDQ